MDYLVANKDYLAQLCADDVKEYVDQRDQFKDFLPDYQTAFAERLKSKVADEVSGRLACDREMIEIVLDEVGIEWLK